MILRFQGPFVILKSKSWNSHRESLKVGGLTGVKISGILHENPAIAEYENLATYP